jgi:hypothetical protein
MKCGSNCENMKFHMGEYLLKSNMFTIKMEDCDVVLSVE